MNKRLLSYYDYRMPLFIAEKITELGYDPDRYVEWIGKFPNLYPEEKIYFRGLTKRSKSIALWTYYFIGFYLFCALMVATLSPIVALIALVLAPAIVIGSVYLFVSAIHSAVKGAKTAGRKVNRAGKRKKLEKKRTRR